MIVICLRVRRSDVMESCNRAIVQSCNREVNTTAYCLMPTAFYMHNKNI